MKKYTNLIYCLFILVISCQENINSNLRSLKQIEKVEYLHGFLGDSKLEIVNNKEFICHYDLVTHKKFVAKSIDGKEAYTIDLKPVINEIGQLSALEIVSWDSIYVLPAYSTAIYLINGQGTVQQKIDLSGHLKQDDHFELMCINKEFVFNDTSMLFALDFRPESLPVEWQDDIEKYDEASYKSPKIFVIDNFKKDSLSVRFGAKELYQRFISEDVISFDMRNFRSVNDQLIFISMLVDSIYVINPGTLEIESSKKMQSDYTDIVVDHITREEDLKSNNQLFMYNSFSNGYLVSIDFDPLSQHYIAMTVHKPNDPENRLDRGLSMIILDSAFNKIKEILLDKSKYNLKCYTTSNGIYIASNIAHREDTNYRKKNNYTLFRYE